MSKKNFIPIRSLSDLKHWLNVYHVNDNSDTIFNKILRLSCNISENINPFGIKYLAEHNKMLVTYYSTDVVAGYVCL